jgi:pyruvate dehydrogenase E2 component (dihydrolipoamide acetyltransferase)
MSTEVFIPKLGQTVEQVTIIRWLLDDGAPVSKGQEVIEVETDKAVFPVESSRRGFLRRGPFNPGEVLPVLTVVAVITEKADEPFSAPWEQAAAAEGVAPVSTTAVSPEVKAATLGSGGSRIFVSPRARALARQGAVDLTQVEYAGARIKASDVQAYLDAKQVRVTPLARNMAAGAGLDLRTVAGSGPGGRIHTRDVQRLLDETMPSPQPEPVNGTDGYTTTPLAGVRAVIARRMVASVQTAAHVTLTTEADATELVNLREHLKGEMGSAGYAPSSYNDLLIFIAAHALHEQPNMNARLVGETIQQVREINIGLAVDTERGLLVPVVRGADQKGIAQIARETRELAARARQGKALPDDLNGGTFTITNLGMYDIDAFTPIINLPECAILGVGRIVEKPVGLNGQIVLRKMLALSLSFDHRLNDGAPAARFLQRIKQLVEQPFRLLL